MNFAAGDLAGLIAAILGGAAVGVERQRSGHASGPHARIGGVRTFALLGTLSGTAGILLARQYATAATLLIAGMVALIAIGYLRASRGDVDATTEVAALVVVAAGIAGGLGQARLSAGLATFTVLVLAEKTRLHRWTERLDETTLLAAARFAVMSVVILPLLPDGPFGPAPGIRPRELWILVLLFSGLSFVGMLASRAQGPRGYAMTGLLGGVISSTAVTLAFARQSRMHPQNSRALAAGAVAASALLFVRVATVVTALQPSLLPPVAKYLALPFVTAVIAFAVIWPRQLHDAANAPPVDNPLQLRNAIEMALVFQVALFVTFFARERIGDVGVVAGGALVGAVDIDALTLAMARGVDSGTAANTAATAIVLGVLANSAVKAALAWLAGERRYAALTSAALVASAVAAIAALAWF